MFAGKAGAYPSEAPFRDKHSSLLQKLEITDNFFITMVEVTDGDKHSSFLHRGINYGRKKFYNTACREILATCLMINKRS
jgi:hypothetical protein